MPLPWHVTNTSIVNINIISLSITSDGDICGDGVPVETIGCVTRIAARVVDARVRDLEGPVDSIQGDVVLRLIVDRKSVAHPDDLQITTFARIRCRVAVQCDVTADVHRHVLRRIRYHGFLCFIAHSYADA